ncbi:MAG: NAD(P)H-binding protein [Methylococcales bacterium]
MTYQNNKPLSLLLVGATGAVGRQVLALALANPQIGRVVAPTRRPLPEHVKLFNPVIDFTHLPTDAPWWAVDAVICTLGTTIKTAGSQVAFAAIDRDLPIEVAKLARAKGAGRFALNSALGAKPTGNFYSRTKAEAEIGIRNLNYPHYTIVRPSLIDTVREESRPGEHLGLIIARLFRPLIPLRYRAVKAERIALALLNGVLSDQGGECVIEADQLQT